MILIQCGLVLASASASRKQPRAIGLGGIQSLYLLPGLDRARSRGNRLAREKLTHEIDVPPVGNPGEWMRALAEPNVLLDEAPIGEAAASGELAFPPAVQPIPRPRLLLETGNELPGFPFQKAFRLSVVDVVHDTKAQ